MVLARRRVGDDVVGDAAVRDAVRALLQDHRRHARHRLDVLRVDLVELLDPVEDAGKLLLERPGFRVRDLNARQARNARPKRRDLN